MLYIRFATQDDIPDISILEQECFSSPWSAQVLESEFQNTGTVFFAAIYDEKLAGYAGMSVILDEGYIANVAVCKQFRRNGIASALLKELLHTAQERKLLFVTLETRESNAPAIALYEKYQFQKVGRRKRFYSSPNEDAILMTQYLQGGISE